GGAILSEEDLAPVLHQFKSDLMSKNVAAEVSNKLADSVRTAIVGKKTERFTSIAKTVKEALKESIETLLTPKKSVDVLRAAMAAKNAGRVYVIVFLGVNGVGKSTNLAKAGLRRLLRAGDRRCDRGVPVRAGSFGREGL
ncbi:unnamed protein product, partial [Prorocentrum cordatum]